MNDPVAMLRDATTIAVVGFSRDPIKAAHAVPAALHAAGYRVIPVNPSADEILGLPCYPTLRDIPADVTVDLVNVFRPSRHAPAIATRAAAIGAAGLWLQQGIVSDEARAIAREAGMDYVEDLCIGVIRATYQLTPA